MSVEVREVPSPRPATFCGGIGDYRLAASANPTALRVGDPLTLTLDIERGRGERIARPDLGAGPRGQFLSSPPISRSSTRIPPAARKEKSSDSSMPCGRSGPASAFPHLAVTCLQSGHRKVLGDRDRADRPRRFGGQSPGRGRSGRVGCWLRHAGNQVAGTGHFSECHRSVGAEDERVTWSRWPRSRPVFGVEWRV